MKTIKVLGSGCAKCAKTAETITRVAAELGVEVMLLKATDPQLFMQYGVMSTPAVVVDEVLVHSGSIPHRSEIERWLTGQ